MENLSPASKGSYVLLLHKRDAGIVRIGRKGDLHFPAGWYGYVGSAMGGLTGRLRHHCGTGRKPHWHIDWLKPHVSIAGIICGITDSRIECEISRHLSRTLEPVTGFGASGCTCQTHLYYTSAGKTLEEAVYRSIKDNATHTFMTECRGIFRND